MVVVALAAATAGAATPGDSGEAPTRLADPMIQRAIEVARIDAAAQGQDPAYAALRAQRAAIVDLLRREVIEQGLEVDGEGALVGYVPEEVQQLLDRLEQVTIEMERTEGYREMIRRLAETTGSPAVGGEMHAQRAAASDKHFTINVYRDPSVPWWYPDWMLTAYVDAAMANIGAAIRSASRPWWCLWCSGYRISWTVNFKGTADVTGCDASGGTSPGSGTTFNVYFRYHESSHNGWGWTGSKAVIDLLPTGACGNWGWDWDNVAITTHELGHVFDADHEDAGTCGVFNDLDCGGSGCGFQLCDIYSGCVMEYADGGTGTTVFCGNDAERMLSFAKSR